jgi:hypothetical protein
MRCHYGVLDGVRQCCASVHASGSERECTGYAQLRGLLKNARTGSCHFNEGVILSLSRATRGTRLKRGSKDSDEWVFHYPAWPFGGGWSNSQKEGLEHHSGEVSHSRQSQLNVKKAS